MAATVLNSPLAIQMSVFVVRAFLRLRAWVADQAELAARLAELERRVGAHEPLLDDGGAVIERRGPRTAAVCGAAAQAIG